MKGYISIKFTTEIQSDFAPFRAGATKSRGKAILFFVLFFSFPDPKGRKKTVLKRNERLQFNEIRSDFAPA
jgi:hypothetical protein